MRDVIVHWGSGKLGQDIEIGTHKLRADEPADKGGDDNGPQPHELLMAALGSCTAMTLKMYAERKGWPLRDVRVKVSGDSADGKYLISRTLTFTGELDAEQRQRLVEIAGKCPVHKTLTGTIAIDTTDSATGMP
jgi:putative redox protein